MVALVVRIYIAYCECLEVVLVSKRNNDLFSKSDDSKASTWIHPNEKQTIQSGHLKNPGELSKYFVGSLVWIINLFGSFHAKIYPVELNSTLQMKAFHTS